MLKQLTIVTTTDSCHHGNHRLLFSVKNIFVAFKFHLAPFSSWIFLVQWKPGFVCSIIHLLQWALTARYPWRETPATSWMLRCCKPRQYLDTASTPASVTRAQLLTESFFRFGQFSESSLRPRSETSHLPRSRERSLEQDLESQSTALSLTCSQPRRLR